MRTSGPSPRRAVQVILGLLIALILAAGSAIAQTPPGPPPGRPPGVPPGPPPGGPPGQPPGRPPLHHDRSNPKPLALSVSNGASGTAVQSAGQQVVVTLRSGTLAGRTGRPISAEAQRLVLGALSADQTADDGSLVAALTPDGNGQARKQATKLSQSLSGLPDHPDRLRPAVQAFNAFVDASSAEFLADPPSEFLAVQAALNPMVEAATLASAQQ